MDFEHKVRKNVKKARRAGITIELDATGERLDDFLRLYEHTLERRDAPERYRFPREFFERLPEPARLRARAARRRASSRPSSCCSRERNAYSFLGGTDSDAFELRPNDLLKWELILWAKAGRQAPLRPRRRLRRRRRDLPLQAQLRAARARAVLRGRRILEPELYAELTERVGGTRRQRILSRVPGRDAVMRTARAAARAARVPHVDPAAVAAPARRAERPVLAQRAARSRCRSLRLLTVTHWGFDGRAHTGQLVVNARVAGPLAQRLPPAVRAALPDPPPELRRRLRPGSTGRRRRHQRLVRVPPGRPVAVHRRHAAPAAGRSTPTARRST